MWPVTTAEVVIFGQKRLVTTDVGGVVVCVCVQCVRECKTCEDTTSLMNGGKVTQQSVFGREKATNCVLQMCTSIRDRHFTQKYNLISTGNNWTTICPLTSSPNIWNS